MQNLFAVEAERFHFSCRFRILYAVHTDRIMLYRGLPNATQQTGCQENVHTYMRSRAEMIHFSHDTVPLK